MRVIGTKVQGHCTITFFHWNNRFLIKLESGPFEQTYKIEEYNLSGESDLDKIVDDTFINQAMLRFDEMANSLAMAVDKL